MGEVVGGAGRDVDRDVADQFHAALGRVGAQRAPLAVEAHLVGQRVRAPANASQSSIQRGARSRKSSSSALVTGAAGSPSSSARPRTPTPTCTAIVLVGRPQREHLPPGLARRGEPIDQGVGVRPEAAAGREVGCSCTPLRNERGSCDVEVEVGYSRPRCPHRSRSATAARIQDPDAAADRRLRAGTRPSARQATRRRVRRIFRDGHEKLRAVVRSSAPGRRRAGSRSELRPSTRTSTACAGRGLRGRRRRAAGSSRSRPGPTAGRPGATSSGARSRPARRTSRASCPRASCCSTRPRAREGADAARRARARRAADDDAPEARVRRRARPGAVRRHGAPPERTGRPRWTRRSRSGSTACSPASAPGTSSSPAPSAASAARRGRVPELAGLGFDVVYLPPSTRSASRTARAATTRSRPARTTPARRGRSAPREGGHDAVDPGLGTSEDECDLCTAAAEHGMDVASTSRSSARADHPWLTEHPEWFHHRPDGTLKYAENPPKRYQDIYNFNWDTRTGRPLARAARRRPRWVEPG